MKKIIAFVVAILATTQIARAEVVQEVIFFVSEDGRSYQRYTGLRTDSGSYNLFFGKGATLDDYLYFFPNEFSWDRSGADNDIIRLQQGDYSFLQQSSFEDEVEIADNGDFVYETSRDKDPQSNRYGYWNTPYDFTKFVYVWVLPENLDVVDAKSNREGEWVRRNNAIAWFGKDVNNVSFTMRYRAKTGETLKALQKALGTGEGVSFEQAENGVRLTLAETVLFPSGSATLSDGGKALIVKLAKSIDFGAGLRAVVEGHTDNVPISGQLTETFPTNWELSAARSLAVVRAMQAAGAPGEGLEARAFGEHRPIADNSTTAGRAKNRRISVLITDG